MLRRFFRRPEPEPSPNAPDDRVRPAILVREGEVADLRTHTPANLAAFQRWYADREIAELLRHDLEPLNAVQSRGYFETFILPLSNRGVCYAIHDHETGELVGTTAITDITTTKDGSISGLFRIVIGEKDLWGRGLGTDATKLVLQEAFDDHDLDEVRLEVFRHNPRAIAAYRRVGFRVTGEHVEWISRRRVELHVLEMTISADEFWERYPDTEPDWDDDSDDVDGETADAEDTYGPETADTADENTRDDDLTAEGDVPAVEAENDSLPEQAHVPPKD